MCIRDRAIRRNKELQRRTKGAVHKTRRRKQDGHKKPGTPYFRSQDGGKPPDNQDTLMLKQKQQGIGESVLERLPLIYGTFKWKPSDEQKVRDVVIMILQGKQMDTIDDGALDTIEGAIQAIRDMGLEALCMQHRHCFNTADFWEEVARQAELGIPGSQIRQHWVTHLDPDINTGEWGIEEKKRLRELALLYNESDWRKIAKELDTGRTPAACLSKWQRGLSTSLVRSGATAAWSSLEDSDLRKAVEEHGQNEWLMVALNGRVRVRGWGQVAKCMQTHRRTAAQCLQRWSKTVCSHKKGFWNSVEQMQLTCAVAAYEDKGADKGDRSEKGDVAWALVQRHVEGRTDMQCRERWINICSKHTATFTQSDDHKLLQVYAEMRASSKDGQISWSQIAREMGGWSDSQIWRRWQKLVPIEQVDDYKRRRDMKKRLIPPKFTHHTEARDNLGIMDLGVRLIPIAAPGELTPKHAKQKSSSLTGPGLAPPTVVLLVQERINKLIQQTPAAAQTEPISKLLFDDVVRLYVSTLVTKGTAALVAPAGTVPKKRHPSDPPRPCKKARISEALEERFCICQSPYKPGDDMVGCDGPCGGWYHYACIGLSEAQVQRIDVTDKWYCNRCSAAEPERV
eukprot:TRINITY_DN10848_c0_g1_i3.p1 TRINITY_DN10848_c0_g1~~TRINITY_DN10848_c0_g1_i3.p1  ORF type:complete len:625 (+),score=131.78 TRINITY_DN10848_c0_g1_i3:169-2043(+)